MTEFQVGDRVSVEGVVTQLWPDAKPGPLTLVRVVGEGYEDDSELWFADQALTLVDRPRRKLRVGSVWERSMDFNDPNKDRHRFLVVDPDGTTIKLCSHATDVFEAGTRGVLGTGNDFSPNSPHWREVPVEELEAEANA